MKTLPLPVLNEQSTPLNWSAIHSCLLESWHKSENPQVITLTRQQLEQLKGDREEPEFSGLSVLFRLTADGGIYLESAGGVNAAALMGRFSVADSAIGDAVREIAWSQEKINPHVIFAEIIHLADPHIDNVNRRQDAWSWEIPVTGAAVSENQLKLTDLYVTVSGGKVVLWSGKHQKPVIPRLTSAYNHSLDKLPLFRFLADLPHQYGRSSIAFDMSSFFPGLSFYPRVVFGETILYPATWFVTGKKLPGDLPAVFMLEEGDRGLLFHRDKPHEWQFFLQCIKNKPVLRIREVPEDDHTRQFSACLYTDQPIKIPALRMKPGKSFKTPRTFLPGSQWLYLKIYSPRMSADKLLLRILPLLRQKYHAGHISQWFFVRYEDHAPHMRIRLLICPEAIPAVINAFKSKLSVNRELIREYQLDIYNRELERYEACGIETAEFFFWKSSELMAGYLRAGLKKTAPPLFIFAIVTLKDMLEAVLPGGGEQIAFTLTGYRQFLAEYDGAALKYELDKKYRQLYADLHHALNDKKFYHKTGVIRPANAFIAAAGRIQQTLENKANGDDVLFSLAHMHLNRLFAEEGRKQEMIVYYLLHKYLLSERGRARQGILRTPCWS